MRGNEFVDNESDEFGDNDDDFFDIESE